MIETAPEFFPIRTLSARTSVGTSTLRAWERRYGLLKPKRTPKGHRLYTEEDVRLVAQVVDMLNQGTSISEAARRLLKAPVLDTFDPEVFEQAGSDSLQVNQWERLLQLLLAAIEDFSAQRIDAVYNEASSIYPLELVSKNLIEPALTIIGERWRNRETGIAEEHFFSAWLRNKLGARIHHAAAQSHGQTLVVACVPGHRHEIGTLLFALAALGRGYRLVYLGGDMPLEPLPRVVSRATAKGVILTGGREPDRRQSLDGLAALVPLLNCPLFVGGSLSSEYASAIEAVGAVPIGEQFTDALNRVTAMVPVYPPRGRA